MVLKLLEIKMLLQALKGGDYEKLQYCKNLFNYLSKIFKISLKYIRQNIVSLTEQHNIC